MEEVRARMSRHHRSSLPSSKLRLSAGTRPDAVSFWRGSDANSCIPTKSAGKPRKPARLQTTSKLRQLRIQAEAEREITDAEVEEKAVVTKNGRRQSHRLKEAGSRKRSVLCVSEA